MSVKNRRRVIGFGPLGRLLGKFPAHHLLELGGVRQFLQPTPVFFAACIQPPPDAVPVRNDGLRGAHRWHLEQLVSSSELPTL